MYTICGAFMEQCTVCQDQECDESVGGCGVMISKFNHQEAVRLATAIEERGYRFYSAAAKRVKDEFARNILAFLAEQENQHKEAFQKLGERIAETQSTIEELDPEASSYIEALAKTYIFPENEQDFIDSIQTFDEVLQYSIQAEKDSILFYLEMAENSKNQDSVKIFKALTNEEKKHLVKLHELARLVEERGIHY